VSVTFIVHGVTLLLAWFVAMTAAVSVLSAGAALVADTAAVARSARFWMIVRLAPAMTAILFVTLLFAPSYWVYEPRENIEGFDVTATMIAGVGLLMILASAVRALSAWRSARRRVNHWMARAQRIEVPGTTLPAYHVDADHPMLALTGVLRPRLLVTRGLLEALTPAELEAAVAHEIGHQHGRDNLKRLMMAGAPDWLACFGSARRIERHWAAAAERTADRISVPNIAAARCALASALVKVARLTPPSIDRGEPISTLISGGEIAARVQHLLSDDDTAPLRAERPRLRAALACGGAAVALAAYAPLLRSVHELTEVLLRSVP
jgi:beta-lactamase regulating signal transducer with metallopeptidase domain